MSIPTNESRQDKAARIARLHLGVDSEHQQALAIQTIQTGYRLRLIDRWLLEPGMRILELGCGQGDMTTVLADAVGPSGHVLATDPAGADYGAPVTLSDATQHVKAGPLGDRLEFKLNFDVNTAEFPAGHFDAVVLAHCAWYFQNTDEVVRTLERVRPWVKHGGKLCLAEWDLEPTEPRAHLPHLLSVIVQGQLHAAGLKGSGNVRTPLSRNAMLHLIEQAGWQGSGGRKLAAKLVDTVGMQDGEWEIHGARHALSEAKTQGLPQAVIDLASSQLDVVESVKVNKVNLALPAYAISAYSL
jgi:SAM-dependent methyltransferase